MAGEGDRFWHNRWAQAGGEICFLLLPEFSMLELFCAVDPLRIASRLGGSFTWRLLSPDGEAVVASNGSAIAVNAALDEKKPPAILFVMASYSPLAHVEAFLEGRLRRIARHGTLLCAADTGAFVLARAGLLAGRRVAVHWEAAAAFGENYPEVTVHDGIYAFDRDVLSCAGGSAVIDMMLFFIDLQHGPQLARAVAEQLVHPAIRAGDTPQKRSAGLRYAIRDRRIARAVTIMGETIAAPLPVAAIAGQIGLSPRQFERLCLQHLGRSAKSFYLSLRLEHARQILTDSNLDMATVALNVGFESAAHFSRQFRRVFGHSPASIGRKGVSAAPEASPRLAGLLR